MIDVHQKLERLFLQIDKAGADEERADILLEILKLDVDNSQILPLQKRQEITQEYVALAAKLKNDFLIAWAKYFEGSLQSHSESLSIASDLFSKLQLHNDEAKAQLKLGIILRQQGRSLEALDCYHRALDVHGSEGEPKFLSRVYNCIANVYEDTGNLSEAVAYHFRSLKIKEDLNDWLGIAISYNNIGKVHMLNANYDKAVEYMEKALVLLEKKKQYNIELVVISNISTCYFRLAKYDEAVKVSQKALKVLKAFPNNNIAAYIHNGLGNVYFEKHEYERALKCYKNAFKFAENSHATETVAGALNSLGICYLELGNLKMALSCLRKALPLATNEGKFDLVRYTQMNFYDYYKRVGDYQKALEHYEKYVEVDRKIQNEESTKKIASMQFGYQIAKKEQEVSFEREKKNEIQKAYDLLDVEKQRSESLLLNILPEEVARELKEKGSAEAKLFKNVTVLFTDFKGFTTLSELLTPSELVKEIHECFTAFDRIIGKYSIEKIKTVGDAYLAVSGLPNSNSNHAIDAVDAAIEIRDFMLSRKQLLGNKTFEIRIGINSGEAIAGIVGMKKYAYDIWGDSVNTAARMEQNCEPGKVNISQSTYELVGNVFDCVYRGDFEAKNKGLLSMYYVDRHFR